MNTVLKQGIDTPWRIWNQIGCWLSYPLVRIIFVINGVSWGNKWRFFGLPIIQKHRHSIMRFGDNLQLRSFKRSAPLCPNHPVIICTLNATSVIKIGDNFGMNGGVICAAEKIVIGDNVTVGANTTIIDTDFHPSSPKQRRLNPNNGLSSPTIIGDDVFIGANCFILRGVKIGSGSVVGTGSVVTQEVPSGMIVFGNPARIVGRVP